MSSEKLHGEIPGGHEQLDLHAESKHNLERLQKEAEATEHDHSIDKLQESIHKEAVSAKEVTVGEHRTDDNQTSTFTDQKVLKADAYKRTIQKVRNHLSPTERALSKIVHNSTLEPITEISSRTIGRPSGILGGGIAALVGSSAVLYMAKHYGFSYNFTTFLVLITGGFVIGLLVELLFRLLSRKQA